MKVKQVFQRAKKTVNDYFLAREIMNCRCWHGEAKALRSFFRAIESSPQKQTVRKLMKSEPLLRVEEFFPLTEHVIGDMHVRIPLKAINMTKDDARRSYFLIKVNEVLVPVYRSSGANNRESKGKFFACVYAYISQDLTEKLERLNARIHLNGIDMIFDEYSKIISRKPLPLDYSGYVFTYCFKPVKWIVKAGTLWEGNKRFELSEEIQEKLKGLSEAVELSIDDFLSVWSAFGFLIPFPSLTTLLSEKTDVYADHGLMAVNKELREKAFEIIGAAKKAFPKLDLTAFE